MKNWKASNRSSGFTLIELFIVITIVSILMATVMPSCTNLKKGTGQKVGQVVKLGKEGIFKDTWEAQLIRGGMTNGSGSLGMQPFNFTIERESLVNEVEALMKNQTEVIIEYRTEGIYSPLRSGSHGNFLVSIKPQRQLGEQ